MKIEVKVKHNPFDRHCRDRSGPVTRKKAVCLTCFLNDNNARAKAKR